MKYYEGKSCCGGGNVYIFGSVRFFNTFGHQHIKNISFKLLVLLLHHE